MSEETNKPDEAALRARFEASMKNASKKERRAPRRHREPREHRPDDPHFRQGVITSIAGDDVFVELGPRVQGVISLREFEKPPNVGEQFEFSMVSVSADLWTLSRQEARKIETWKGLKVGRRVTAHAIGLNSGGLEMKIGPVAAFMPHSQIDLAPVADLTPLIQQQMLCEVTEVNAAKKRVILSRRRVLEDERRQQREQALAALAVGQVLRGRIEKIEKFGAFVEIGPGLSGLLHVSNIAHKRIEDPATVLKVGDEVEVKVLEIKDKGRKIGLGMKQLRAHPWDGIDERYNAGQRTAGRVTRIQEFGAFVELEPGVEGLLHVSQLSPTRVARVEDAVKTGDEVTVRILEIDRERRRMALSRLTPKGVLIGSEGDADEVEKSEKPGVETRIYREGSAVPRASTNLGELLRQALERRK